MKTSLVLFSAIFALLLLTASSMPLEDELQEAEEGEEQVHLRQKRVTCDLLSFSIGGFSFNDSACAAHCLKLRRRGGRCKNGVCVCRK